MTEPSFLLNGNTPFRDDTRRMIWLKILGVYQSLAGALPVNNPFRDDPSRVIKEKLLKAIRNAT